MKTSMDRSQINAILDAIVAAEIAEKAFPENKVEGAACRVFAHQMREFLKTVASADITD